MFSIGNFIVSDFYQDGEKWFIVAHRKKRDHHTHVPSKCGFNSAKMIAVRAHGGAIPEHYPAWMVESVNRLWYGKDFVNRTDLDNSNLFTNDSKVRIKPKHRKKNYVNTHGSKHRSDKNELLQRNIR